MTKTEIMTAVVVSSGWMAFAANAQSSDISLGRKLAEVTCSECHQIDAESHNPEARSGAPSFVAIGGMSSMTELAIKVFLQSSHPTMPNIILTRQEIDSIAAYIKSLARK